MTQRIIDHEKVEILRLTRDLVRTVRRFESSDAARTPEQKVAAVIEDRLEVVDRLVSLRWRATCKAAAKKRAKTKRAKLRAEKARVKQ